MTGKLEEMFLNEGPAAFFWLGVFLCVAPLFALIALVFGGWGNGGASALLTLAVLALPAATSFATSRALRARHPLTVPLVLLLCVLGLMTLRGGFGGAIEGITPTWLLVPLLYLVTALELLVIAFIGTLTVLLWRKGRFDRGRGA